MNKRELQVGDSVIMTGTGTRFAQPGDHGIVKAVAGDLDAGPPYRILWNNDHRCLFWAGSDGAVYYDDDDEIPL